MRSRIKSLVFRSAVTLTIKRRARESRIESSADIVERVWFRAVMARLETAYEAVQNESPAASWLCKVLPPLVKTWKLKYRAANGDLKPGEPNMETHIDELVALLKT